MASRRRTRRTRRARRARKSRTLRRPIRRRVRKARSRLPRSGGAFQVTRDVTRDILCFDCWNTLMSKPEIEKHTECLNTLINSPEVQKHFDVYVVSFFKKAQAYHSVCEMLNNKYSIPNNRVIFTGLRSSPSDSFEIKLQPDNYWYTPSGKNQVLTWLIQQKQVTSKIYLVDDNYKEVLIPAVKHFERYDYEFVPLYAGWYCNQPVDDYKKILKIRPRDSTDPQYLWSVIKDRVDERERGYDYSQYFMN